MLPSGLKLCALGYGNETALVNDPRADPWGGDGAGGPAEGGEGQQREQEQQQQQPGVHPGTNCVVSRPHALLVAYHEPQA